MSEMNRRELGVALAALAGLYAAGAEAQAAPAGPMLSHSQIFHFDELPSRAAANGMVTRDVLRGTLATGEYVEVHETRLPAGEMPHPPHRHTHSEFLLIRDGTLQVESDGQRSLVHAGDIVFTASAVLHGLKNVGDLPANYFVVAVGLQKAIT